MKVIEPINYDKNIRMTFERPPVRHRFAQVTKTIDSGKVYKRKKNWSNSEN